MTGEYEFSKFTGRCAVTDRPLEEGEAYYAVLLEEGESFSRRDYSTSAWTGPPEGSFCFWKARVPVKAKKSSIAIDLPLLIHLFQRMEQDESPARQRFRFVLALLLMRKRTLRFEKAVREGEQEFWQMRLTTDQSQHQVLNPSLSDEEIASLSAELTALLSGEAELLQDPLP